MGTPGPCLLFPLLIIIYTYMCYLCSYHIGTDSVVTVMYTFSIMQSHKLQNAFY